MDGIAKTPIKAEIVEKPVKKGGLKKPSKKQAVVVEDNSRELARMRNNIYVGYHPVPPVAQYFSARHASAHMLACGNLADCVKKICEMSPDSSDTNMLGNLTNQYRRTLTKNYVLCKKLDGRNAQGSSSNRELSEWEKRMDSFVKKCNVDKDIILPKGASLQLRCLEARLEIITHIKQNFVKELNKTHKFIVIPSDSDEVNIVHYTVWGPSDMYTMTLLDLKESMDSDDSTVVDKPELTDFCCGTKIELVIPKGGKAMLCDYIAPIDSSSNSSGDDMVSLMFMSRLLN